MPDLYCSNLVNCLSFHQKNVRFCTTLQLGEIISLYQESPNELVQKYVETRKNIIDGLSNGVVPDGCKDCIYKNTAFHISQQIKRIDLYYWYHCNCGCFYCSYIDQTKGEFSDRVKEGNPLVYKTVKELYSKGLIDKNELCVYFGGGEIGVLKEFPKLVNLFLKNDVKNIWCETSGIRFSRELAKALEKGKAGLSIAICSGSREIYKKIKKRDKYNQVLKNIKKYVKAAEKFKGDESNPYRVISKFIILQGFNNTKEEIDRWLFESKKIGVRRVEISMEFCWGIHTKSGQKVEDYNYELFDYTEKKCEELGLSLTKNETSLALLQKGTY